MLTHLPREEGFGLVKPTKNGKPLAGYGAKSTRKTLVATMSPLPEKLRQSLTWDRGKELSDHVGFANETGTPVFFAEPRSPWQRGNDENTNGLLRNYFPKGTDLSRWSANELTVVADTLNYRPRKILDWRTPAEVFNEQIRSLEQVSDASTG